MSSVHVAVGILFLLCQSVAATESATFYRVGEINGIWWFIGPDGQQCFSSGVNVITPGVARDRLKAKQPANVTSEHDPGVKAWSGDAMSQLKEWGFNTVGAWSSAEVKRGPLPYVDVLHIGKRLGVPWNDLLSPRFTEQVDKLVAADIGSRANDPNVLGWCTDNELGWYPDTMFLYHLKQRPESATRRALIQLLREHYESDFGRLETDFRTESAKTFAELEAGGELRLRPNGSGMQVVDKFASMLAERYYHTMHDAIRRYDSHHLILGDRYAGYCSDAVARAAGPYVDVVSTNFDHPAWTDGSLPLHYLERLHGLSGKPVLVTEYYVAAKQNESGNKNSGNVFTTVETQRERTAAVRNRFTLLASQPYVVGAHWFQYMDEPTEGRDDGEDYNFGLIDIHSRPYEQLTSAFARLHENTTTLHAKTRPDSKKTLDFASIPPAPPDALSGLTEWDTQRARLGSSAGELPFGDLLASWSKEHLFLALSCSRFVDKDLYDAQEIPQKSEQLDWEISFGDDPAKTHVFFGIGDESPVSEPAIDCRLSCHGIRYFVLADVPIRRAGRDALTTGDQINLHASLADRRAGTRMSWNCQLECSGPPSDAQKAAFNIEAR